MDALDLAQEQPHLGHVVDAAIEMEATAIVDVLPPVGGGVAALVRIGAVDDAPVHQVRLADRALLDLLLGEEQIVAVVEVLGDDDFEVRVLVAERQERVALGHVGAGPFRPARACLPRAHRGSPGRAVEWAAR